MAERIITLLALLLTGFTPAAEDVQGLTLVRSKADGAREAAVAEVGAPHPLKSGATALRFELTPQDCAENDCAADRARVELKSTDTEHEGNRSRYSWSFQVAEPFESLWPAREFLAQFHQEGGRPAMLFGIEPEGLMFESRFREQGKALLIPAEELSGRWHDMVVEIVWSKRAGEVRIRVDGEERLLSRQATMSEEEAYFKIGLYRAHISRSAKALTQTRVMYVDEVRRTPLP